MLVYECCVFKVNKRTKRWQGDCSWTPPHPGVKFTQYQIGPEQNNPSRFLWPQHHRHSPERLTCWELSPRASSGHRHIRVLSAGGVAKYIFFLFLFLVWTSVPTLPHFHCPSLGSATHYRSGCHVSPLWVLPKDVYPTQTTLGTPRLGYQAQWYWSHKEEQTLLTVD